MGVTAGLNIAGWQLRHNGQWQWQDTPAENQSKSDYQETSTYLQRAFPKYRGVLTLGDSFTNGEVFDSIGYRGIDFSSDDRMLPNSMLGYAPRIRGNAKPMQKLKFVNKANLSIKQRLHQVTLRLMTFTLLVLVVKLKFLLLKQMVKYKIFGSICFSCTNVASRCKPLFFNCRSVPRSRY